MYGISVQYPLVRDEEDGFYKLNKNYPEMVSQNLKNLLLTEKGEKVMDPEFGVGLRSLMFEQNTEAVRSVASTRIQKQISKYMPFLKIMNINYSDDRDRNSFHVSVKVDITPIGKQIIVPINIKDLT